MKSIYYSLIHRFRWCCILLAMMATGCENGVIGDTGGNGGTDNKEEQLSKIDIINNAIQSISYVSDYGDGYARVNYTLDEDNTFVPGSMTLRFEIYPQQQADALVEVWNDAFSLKAFYTMSKAAAGESISLSITDVAASDGIITLTASCEGIDSAFFLKEISANVRLYITGEHTQKLTESIKLIPHATDVIDIPDAKFKSYLVSAFDTDGNNEISPSEVSGVKELKVNGQNITSLSGIEFFTNLKTLDCSSNRLYSIDLSHNEELINVNVSNNHIDAIDLSHNTNVADLDVSQNRLEVLDLSNNAKLVNVNVSDNSLGGLNVNACERLTELDCTGNSIKELDFSNNNRIEKIQCSDNPIEKLTVDNCRNLSGLFISSSKDSNLVLNEDNLLQLYIEEYSGGNFNFSAYNTNIMLIYIRCIQNSTVVLSGDFNAVTASGIIDKLDIGNAPEIKEIDLTESTVPSISLSNSKKLKYFYCIDNHKMVLFQKVCLSPRSSTQDFANIINKSSKSMCGR